MDCVPVKNTFVHFQFESNWGVHHVRRCKSEPPSSIVKSERHNPGSTSQSGSKNMVSITSPAKHGSYKRPSKVKRAAFWKFVETLKEKIRESPGTFSLNDIDIPKKLLDRPTTKQKIATILERFLEEELSRESQAC